MPEPDRQWSKLGFGSAELYEAHVDMTAAMIVLMRANYSTDPEWKRKNMKAAQNFEVACQRFSAAQRKLKK